MKKLLSLLVFGLLLANAPAFANPDDGLYDPVAPKGSAFVRLFNASGSTVDFATSGKKHGAVDAGALSAYFVQKKGEFTVNAGSAKTSGTADEGQYYTAVVKDGKITLGKDAALANRAKALVVFYNLTKLANLSLKTADGKVEVIGAQASGASGSREMNSVKVSFGVFSGATTKASLPDVVLERGKAYAAIAVEGKDGAVGVKWFEASTNTKK